MKTRQFTVRANRNTPSGALRRIRSNSRRTFGRFVARCALVHSRSMAMERNRSKLLSESLAREVRPSGIPVAFCNLAIGFGCCAALSLVLADARSYAAVDSAEFPAAPHVRLMPIDGIDTESAFIEAAQSRVDALANRSTVLADSATAAELRLAAVNVILGELLEPSCTRTFFGIDDAESRDDLLGRRRTALDRVEELLNQVREHLAEAPADSDEAASPKSTEGGKDQESAASKMTKDYALLRAFATAMRAYLLDDPGSEEVDPRRAASGLSSALEDARPEVAASAALWQALLRTRESNPQAALAALDPVLLDPPRNAMPYAFFSRLLRCHTMARVENPAAPIAMLLRVEDAVDEWILGDNAKSAARRAVALVRFDALRAWHDRLDPASHADERRWCVERAALIAKSFTEGDDAVFRLHPAVPLIAKGPSDEDNPPEPRRP